MDSLICWDANKFSAQCLRTLLWNVQLCSAGASKGIGLHGLTYNSNIACVLLALNLNTVN